MPSYFVCYAKYKDEEPEHPGGEYEDEDKKEFPEDSEQK